MQHPSDRPFRNAEAALAAMRAAADLDAAEDAWVDFLHYWVRAINKYDAQGESDRGDAWVKLSFTLRSDPQLMFLWQARNTDEHTIGAVAGRKPKQTKWVPAVEISDGLVLPLGGTPTIDFGLPLGMIFVAAHLHLVSVRNKQGIFDPPLGGDGQPAKPIDLAAYGLEVLRNVLYPPPAQEADEVS